MAEIKPACPNSLLISDMAERHSRHLQNGTSPAGSPASSTTKGALPSGGVTGAGFAPQVFSMILRQVFAVKMFK